MTNIELKVRNIQPELSNTEKKVADYFLANQEKVFNLPISTLAEQAGVSSVSWVRFCKSLGFSGLKDFKKALFTELNDTVQDSEKEEPHYNFSDVKDYADIPQMVQMVTGVSIRALEDTSKLASAKEVELIAGHIISASNVKLFGLGASALVAEDFQNKLIRIGKNCCFCRDSLIQLTYAATCQPSELAIIISNSGETSEVLEILDLVKKSGCTTAAITRFGKNPLAQGVQHHMYTSSSEADRRSGAMSSRMGQLLAVDILFTAVCNRDYANIEDYLEKSHRSQGSHKLGKK